MIRHEVCISELLAASIIRATMGFESRNAAKSSLPIEDYWVIFQVLLSEGTDEYSGMKPVVW
jgi:hypothetical protein